MTYRTILAALASSLLTPLLVIIWSKMAPIATSSKFDKMGFDKLRDRNNRIDVIFTVFMFVGLVMPLTLYYFNIIGKQNFWPVGLAFGFAIILPVSVVAIITLRQSTDRFHEFWRYYELKWKIGLPGIRLLYIPLAIIGIISLFMTLISL